MPNLFERTSLPRVFGVPLGVDFAKDIAAGVLGRSASHQPHDIAKIEIFVNTARMQKALNLAFSETGSLLLPKITLFTGIANSEFSMSKLGVSSDLRRQLVLSRLVSALIDAEPDLAPKSSVYALADSLVRLFDEMESEQVLIESLQQLDVAEQSEHWQRSLKFLSIISPFASETRSNESLHREVAELKAKSWQQMPPEHPILFVGSTASRKTTRDFMNAVAKLPQGAVVLPGFDFDLDETAINLMEGDATPPPEDHPQYRFVKLLSEVGLTFSEVKAWHTKKGRTRNKLISLSLHPAPVTNQWLDKGPQLGDLLDATSDITLLEAPSPREEANAIALGLRQAAANGKTAALVTPDRNLSRQVTAALDIWDLVPDDSAGIPLHLTAPGRILSMVSLLLSTDITVELLFVVLKHPLTFSGNEDRGQHLLRSRELELHFRRSPGSHPSPQFLNAWAKKQINKDPDILEWIDWVTNNILSVKVDGSLSLAKLVDLHLSLAGTICAGSTGSGAGSLWEENAGRKANEVFNALSADAGASGKVTSQEYRNLIYALLAKEVVRDRDSGHPNILILGTLEARVQNTDVVILGGMNEGIWPASPAPDPWLNRKMRKDLGLLLPERQIGLSAHDYQQAVAAKEVWITRSKRDAESETVPARWVNRLCNLIQGLPGSNGHTALEQMRERGGFWLRQAHLIATPMATVEKARRPSPSPPLNKRPTELSVTRIKTLIRDPYAIYAEKVLRLRPLDPLNSVPDAKLRGIVFHKVLERFVLECTDPSIATAQEQFLTITSEVLENLCPWQSAKILWYSQLERVAPHFIHDEIARRSDSVKVHAEVKCSAVIEELRFNLHGVADRIDITDNKSAALYDYKTGAVPSKPQQEKFDKQLLLEAVMIEKGQFEKIPALPVTKAIFLGLKEPLVSIAAPLSSNPPQKTWDEFTKLIENWQNINRGYTSRLALFKRDDIGYFDQLARYGEWDTSEPSELVVLK